MGWAYARTARTSKKNPPFITKTHPKTVSCLYFWNIQVNVYTKLKGTGASVWFVLQPRPHWAETYTPHCAAFCWPTHRCSKRQLLLKVMILSTCHPSPAKSPANEQRRAKAECVRQSHNKLHHSCTWNPGSDVNFKLWRGVCLSLCIRVHTHTPDTIHFCHYHTHTHTYWNTVERL